MKGWLWIIGLVAIGWFFFGRNDPANEPSYDPDSYGASSSQSNGYGTSQVAAGQYDRSMPAISRDEFEERQEETDGDYGTFAGENCTVDCSGHEAGYNWAMDNGITDPSECGGNSWSFIEGCEAYANGE